MGIGLVLLEAMAASRPVIATAVSAIPEIVQDGDVSECSVRRTTRERSRPPSFGWRMPIFARFWAATDALGSERHFTLDRVTDATMAVYRECIE